VLGTAGTAHLVVHFVLSQIQARRNEEAGREAQAAWQEHEKWVANWPKEAIWGNRAQTAGQVHAGGAGNAQELTPITGRFADGVPAPPLRVAALSGNGHFDLAQHCQARPVVLVFGSFT
jgi:hypothetical protein